MKYEITKGSEKDFEGASDSCASIYCSETNEIIAKRRPITEPVWEGEGLPPVGVECEHCPGGTTQTEWEVVKVLAINERPGGVFTDFWLQREDGSSYIIGNPYRFRPIRSPEDVARDEFIKELSGIVIEGSSIGKKFAAALYDAGYRKVDGE